MTILLDGMEQDPTGGRLAFLRHTKDVRVLGVQLIGCTTPAPTWSAHDVACAWTAAWMTVRGRALLGPLELHVDASSSGRRELTHRIAAGSWAIGPDFVGLAGDDRIAVEVELPEVRANARVDVMPGYRLRVELLRDDQDSGTRGVRARSGRRRCCGRVTGRSHGDISASPASAGETAGAIACPLRASVPRCAGS